MTSGDNDEEEAAWLDLIANYDAPVDAGGGSPWPERENLTKQDNASIPGASQVTRSPQAPESPQTTGPLPGIRPPAPADPLSGPDQLDAPSSLDDGIPGAADPRDGGHFRGPGRLGAAGPIGGADPFGDPDPFGDQGDLGERGDAGGPGSPPTVPHPVTPPPARTPAPEPESQEEHYFPPPPPPLPKLDPLSKGAWAALFGGPAYLLIATAVGWTVPAVAAFFAIGAFVGGFAILVLRMGDDPRNGSGPDDGAVV